MAELDLWNFIRKLLIYEDSSPVPPALHKISRTKDSLPSSVGHY